MQTKKTGSFIFRLSAILIACSVFFTGNAVFAKDANNEQLNRKLVGYFPEWAYKSDVQGYYTVPKLQWEDLTHIQYSFAMVDESTNKIVFCDKTAAVEEDFSDMTAEQMSHNGEVITLDSSLPYKGHFNLLQVMKKMYPNVKILISIGGWAGSRGFYTMMDTQESMNTFADSCVEFIRKYGFDGVDIDFEYPSSTKGAGNPDVSDVRDPRLDTVNASFNQMMKTLREKLDQAGEKDNKHYSLSAAVTASSWVLGGVSSNEYANYLDFLSVMSYDFHGGWNNYVENQADIYPDPADNETSKMPMPVLCMDWAYRYYRGVLPPEKILMGIPYYTRGWENVSGGVNGLHGLSSAPATGKYNIWGDPDPKRADGKVPAGVNPLWYVMNLMENDPDLKVYFDEVGKVPHVWQSKEKVFLTYENPQSIDERLKYIKDKNLGGALIWVMNGDYGVNPNYEVGSDDVNKGKYTFGSVLTDQLGEGLISMGQCAKTDDSIETDGKIAVSVDFGGKYDHPNYTYSIKVKNYTDETIPGGWKVAFDLPNSAIFSSTYGGEVQEKSKGDFTTITITSPSSSSIDPGAEAELTGAIKLCFSGVRNITFNDKTPVGDAPTVQWSSGITTSDVTDDGFKLSWDKATYQDDTINYKITGAGLDGKDIGESCSYTFTGLDTKQQYKVTVEAYDKDNSDVLSKTKTVTAPQPSYPAWSADEIYHTGDKVTYIDGNNYEARWYADKSNIPGKGDPWVLITE